MEKNYKMTIKDLEKLKGDSYSLMRYFARHGMPVIRLKKGRNVAYAYMEKDAHGTDSDVLGAIASSGGGVGTDLFKEILKEQAKQGRGLQWHADKDSADSFYKKLGLGKYFDSTKTNNTFNHYKMSSQDVKDYVTQMEEPKKWVTINGKHIPIFK